MRLLVTVAVGTLACGMLALVGGLMLFSPRRYIMLLNWWTRAGRWSKPNPEFDPSSKLGLRATGIPFMAGGLVFAYFTLDKIAYLESLGPRHLAPSLLRAFGLWVTIAAALTMVVSGCISMIWPEVTLRLVPKLMPHGLIDDSRPRHGLLWFRGFGGFLMAFGIWVIINTLMNR
jgi:hypothetical protein